MRVRAKKENIIKICFSQETSKSGSTSARRQHAILFDLDLFRQGHSTDLKLFLYNHYANFEN